MHMSVYIFESLFLHRKKKEKVSSVFVLEMLKGFLCNILFYVMIIDRFPEALEEK